MFTVSEQVQEAIETGLPVLALETAVLTSGLPRTPWTTEYGDCPDCIDASVPVNLALANALTARVSEKGVLPVWIGVFKGKFKIGLTVEEIESLCTDDHSRKVTLATIAQTMNMNVSAGTTVATSLLGCKLASQKNPIRVFATGGIGGLHQEWSTRFDISADLTALASTPTCVVASGAKSILDVHATVQALETIGVPTIGIGCDTFPTFIERGNKNDPPVLRVHSIDDLATLCHTHWNTLRLQSAVLASVPVPDNVAIDRGSLTEVMQKIETSWLSAGLPSATRTPFVLNELAVMTKGTTLRANVELLFNNVKVASEIALVLY